MQNTFKNEQQRLTAQFLLPPVKPGHEPGRYDIYPVHPLGDGHIFSGFATLAREMAGHALVMLDGFQGVFFEEIRQALQIEFDRNGTDVHWLAVASVMKSQTEIDNMVAPFLGGDDPLFGTRTDLQLLDFFDQEQFNRLVMDVAPVVNIYYGSGAALFADSGLLVYIDLPKNELQYRARALAATNLGSAAALEMQFIYKRFYFVDWVVLNRHKQAIADRVDLFADGQRPGELHWARAGILREAWCKMSRNVFRVRPWFEPGAWGGDWCLNNICQLNKNVPNYAWSFELIVPENGLLFESSGLLLELSFDFLMFREAPAVLGDAFERFGTDFPIRFDFLDTFSGGNLSLQCHPLPAYTKKCFNEGFTQEEAYYLLDAAQDAIVYLGFQDDIDPDAFRKDLEISCLEGKKLNIENYVKTIPSKKHDFFLIPPGTIHASGRNNLVLEISTTPYIFTFKMYDWLRPDLNGKPRPLNISRAMENLCFERKGEYVDKYLISKPIEIDSGPGWQVFHLPAHANHCYDVHRIHLKTSIEIHTGNKLHVLNLVGGDSILLVTAGGEKRQFSYAETFVVPAAAVSYTLVNMGKQEAILVKAFIKNE